METKKKTVFKKRYDDGFLNPLAVKFRQSQRECKKLKQQLAALKGN